MMIRTTEIEAAATEGASYLECFKGTNLRRTLYAPYLQISDSNLHTLSIVGNTHAGANLPGLLMSLLGTYFFSSVSCSLYATPLNILYL